VTPAIHLVIAAEGLAVGRIYLIAYVGDTGVEACTTYPRGALAEPWICRNRSCGCGGGGPEGAACSS